MLRHHASVGALGIPDSNGRSFRMRGTVHHLASSLASVIRCLRRFLGLPLLSQAYHGPFAPIHFCFRSSHLQIPVLCTPLHCDCVPRVPKDPLKWLLLTLRDPIFSVH